MAIASVANTTATVSASLASIVQGGQPAANTNAATVTAVNKSQLEALTVVSQSSSTSVSGQVTTTITYADGSTKTTVSDGDTVIISSKKEAA